MTSIKAGDDIVCVDDDVLPEQYIEVRKGEVYKATWVGPANSYMNGDYIGVRLAGISRGPCPQFGDEDPPFNARRFRPVVSPKIETKAKEEELV